MAEDMQTVCQIRPDQAADYCSVGLALQKLNRWEEAAANYQVALAIEPDFAAALENLNLLAKEQRCRGAGDTEGEDPLYQNSRLKIDKALCSTPSAIRHAIRQYYSDERMGFFQTCLQFLKNSGIILKDKHVVDVACGMGYQLRLVLECMPAGLTGLDFSRVAIEIARLLCPGGRFYEFDIYQKY
ncbi:MAG: class I SAM-dependent methyltransferase, partial [Planctomycetota bacterium]